MSFSRLRRELLKAAGYGGLGLLARPALAQQPQCQFTPAPTTSTQLCASTAFVQGALQNSTALSAGLDAAFGSAQGSILYRGASNWTVLTPGTSGNFLTTLGASANPQWSTAATSPIVPIPTQSWFVSAAGNDSNNGQSLATAFLTIQHAFDVVLGYDLNGTGVVTINVGAGTFAGWSVIGPARGWTGDQQTGASLGACSILVLGAGSGSTNITAMASDAEQNIGVSGGLYIGIEGMNIEVTSPGSGINVSAWALLSLVNDIIFTGAGASATAMSVDAFGFVFNSGTVTIKGTLGIYFDGFNTADYESIGGSVTIAGAVTTFCTLSLLSNMHGETVSLGGGGSTTSVAYTVDSLSVLELATPIVPAVWSLFGLLSNGGRSNGAATAPSVNASTGLGTGTAAMTTTSTAYAMQATLSPTGSPSSSGTVQFKINEAPVINSTAAPFTVSLQVGTAAWSSGAIATISAFSNSGLALLMTVSWSNGGSSLTAGKTYLVNLIGQT